MPAKAGTAYIEFEGDFSKLNKQVASKLGGLSKQGKGLGRSLGHGLSTGIGAGAKVAAVGVGALTAEVVRATKGWSEHQAIVRQTNATIKSMGNVAGVTAKHTEKLSDAIERQTGVDGDLIQSAQNVLLTFNNIKNARHDKVFDDTTKAVVNLSKTAFFNGDVEGAAKAVGKALQDPVKGAAALKKGGTLGAQDLENLKQMAKEGKSLAQQQRYILDALEKQAPLIKATPWQRLATIGRQIEDTIGKAVLPQINKLLRAVLPEFQHVANAASDIFDDKNLNWGEKFKKLGASVRHWFGPMAGDMVQGLKDAHLDQKLADAIKWAEPKVLEGVKDIGTKSAETWWEGFKAAPLWAKVGSGAFLASKLGLTGPALKGLMSLLSGGGGGVLSKATPMPVFVTNPGFGLPGGKPGAGPPVPTGPVGAIKGVANIIAKRVVPIAFGISLIDAKGNPIAAAANVPHFLTFGIVPKVIDPGGAGKKNLSDFQTKIQGLASEGNVAGLEKIRKEFDAYSHFDAPGGIDKARQDIDKLIASTKAWNAEVATNRDRMKGFQDRVESSSGTWHHYQRELDEAKDKLHGLKKGSDAYNTAAGEMREAQRRVNERLLNTTHVTPDVKDAVEGLGINFSHLGGTVTNTAVLIEQAVNGVLGGLGAKQIKLTVKNTAAYQKSGGNLGGSGHLARGGPIGGIGIGDKVPALLEPGEYVVNRKAVQRFGKAALDRLNFGDAPRFQGGGIVALGRKLQAEGYAVSENPAFGGVTPGVHVPNSYHYRGMAIDVNADNFPGGEPKALDKLYARLKRMAGIVELLWRVKGHFDHLHVAMSGEGALPGGAATKIPALGIAGPDGMLKDILRGSERTMRSAANDYLATQAGAEGAEPGGAAGAYNKASLKALWIRAGGSRATANLAAAVALAESSGNPGASSHNPVSGGTNMGLWQIDSGSHADSTFDPLGNAKAAIRISGNGRNWGAWETYVKGTYKSFLQRGGLVGLMTMLQRGGAAGKTMAGVAKVKPVKHDNSKAAKEVNKRIGNHLAKIGFTEDQAKLKKLADAVLIDESMASRLAGIEDTEAIQAALNAEMARRGGTSDMTAAQQLALFPATEQLALINSLRPTLGPDKLNQLGWLNRELEDMLAERNILIDEPAALARMKQQAEAQIKALNIVIKRVADEIEDLVKKRDKVIALEKAKHDAINDEKKKKKPNAIRLARLRRQESALHSGGRPDLTAEDRTQIDKELGFEFHHSRVGYNNVLGDMRAANKVRSDAVTTLKESNDYGVVSLPNIAAAAESVYSTMDSLQGPGSPWTKMFSDPHPLGILGPSILDVQKNIRELTDKPPRAEATDAAATAPGESEGEKRTKEILAELLKEANLRTAVSQAQFDVFRNLPFGGSFEAGGTVPGPVGAPRMILAHGGEVVIPNDGNNAPNVSVHFANGMEWLQRFVDIRVDNQTRAQSRRSERQLPGQAGLLRR